MYPWQHLSFTALIPFGPLWRHSSFMAVDHVYIRTYRKCTCNVIKTVMWVRTDWRTLCSDCLHVSKREHVAVTYMESSAITGIHRDHFEAFYCPNGKSDQFESMSKKKFRHEVESFTVTREKSSWLFIWQLIKVHICGVWVKHRSKCWMDCHEIWPCHFDIHVPIRKIKKNDFSGPLTSLLL